MWTEHLILPLIFLFASSALYATRIALENAGVTHFRKELASYKKYYFYYHTILRLDRGSSWASLVNFLRLTHQITRLAYTITITIYLLNLTNGLLGLKILSGHLTVTNLWLLLFFFVTLFALLFLDFTFATLSRKNPTLALKLFAWYTTPFLILFTPISYLMNLFTHLSKKPASEPCTQEVKTKLLEFVQESEITNQLSTTDRNLLISVASFQDRIVREVMVPRIDVFSVSADATIFDCMQQFIDEGYSRIPVYENDIDHIIGILLYKDLLSFYAKDPTLAKSTPIRSLIKPAIFTPETKRISHLLQEFKSKQFHLAIVVDEYGGTEGIITIEDVLEELVGEIEDEYDEGEEKLYHVQPGGGWIVDGKMTILDIAEDLKINLPISPEYETIGGYIFQRAGSIPQKGWRIHHDNFYIEVLQTDEKSIERVRIIPSS